MTLPSDMTVRQICISIGIVSFFVNILTLFLFITHRKMYSTNIFNVVIILQFLYLIQNFHFSILFIPFLYSTLGGGYCIGILCEHHRVPFHINHAIWMFLVIILGGFFILLIFYRHQNLLPESSVLKLRPRIRLLLSFSLLLYLSIPALRYAIVIYRQDTRNSEQLLRRLCPDCQFIEKGVNFGVIDREDSIINGVVVFVVTSSCAIFTLLCGGHIMYLMTTYRNRMRSSSVKTSVNLRQTLLSLIQIVVFGAFLAVPIGFTLSMLWIGNHDLILVSSLLLLSVNSLVDSTVIIIGTPPFRRYIRHLIIRDRPAKRNMEVSSRFIASCSF